MLRSTLKYGGAVSSLIVGILVFIFGESLLISSIYYFGPIITFIFFNICFVLLCLLIVRVYNRKNFSGVNYIKKIEHWIFEKEKILSSKKITLLRYGEFIGITFSALTAGTLVTTIFICILGYHRYRVILFILYINIIFFTTWIVIYSGGIKVFRMLI